LLSVLFASFVALESVSRPTPFRGWCEFAIPIPGASALVIVQTSLTIVFRCCLRDMVKPHDRLVPVSSTDCSASTPGLSTT